jgi:hypothetical protein
MNVLIKYMVFMLVLVGWIASIHFLIKFEG